jgi:PPOX class probable F420-dependent enzyme
MSTQLPATGLGKPRSPELEPAILLACPTPDDAHTIWGPRNWSLHMTPLPDDLLDLLREPSPCFISTLMPDGSPQMTETWVDTDGEHVVINTVDGFLKVKNVRRDPRVALSVLDAKNLSRYFSVRGRVIELTTDGAVDHIEALAQRYLGGPYPWYGGRDQTRIKLIIEADKVGGMG